ncbi:MAG: hypothetical protein WC314_01560 [Vulcanimicrobiota bacterium]
MSKSQAGVSLLLEIVVGLGIFTVALLLVFGVLASSARSSSQAREYAVALHLARENMERLCSLPYPNVVTETAVEFPLGSVVNGVASTVSYQVITEVVEVNPGEQKSVVVTVEWQHSETTRRVRLESLRVQL